MYAVFKSGGKQRRVQAGETVRLEKLAGEEGDSVSFDQVLAVHNGQELSLGSPFVEGAKVSGEIVAHGRGRKITVLKFKRRKNYKRKLGHRQSYTDVRITDISG